MVGRHGDVRRIRSGTRWQRDAGDQRGSHLGDFRRDVQYRESGQQRHPPLGGLGIAGPHLIQHDLRDVEIEKWPPITPPGMRYLLAGGHDEVPAGPGRPISSSS